MNIYSKIHRMISTSSDKQLYMLLNTEEYTNYPYETKGLGENMALVSQVISGWWKPRFLLNHNTKCAYEFMDSNEKLTTVTQDDIAWDTLYGIPKIARIHCLNSTTRSVTRARR